MTLQKNVYISAILFRTLSPIKFIDVSHIINDIKMKKNYVLGFKIYLYLKFQSNVQCKCINNNVFNVFFLIDRIQFFFSIIA